MAVCIASGPPPKTPEELIKEFTEQTTIAGDLTTKVMNFIGEKTSIIGCELDFAVSSLATTVNRINYIYSQATKRIIEDSYTCGYKTGQLYSYTTAAITDITNIASIVTIACGAGKDNPKLLVAGIITATATEILTIANKLIFHKYLKSQEEKEKLQKIKDQEKLVIANRNQLFFFRKYVAGIKDQETALTVNHREIFEQLQMQYPDLTEKDFESIRTAYEEKMEENLNNVYSECKFLEEKKRLEKNAKKLRKQRLSRVVDEEILRTDSAINEELLSAYTTLINQKKPVSQATGDTIIIVNDENKALQRSGFSFRDVITEQLTNREDSTTFT